MRVFLVLFLALTMALAACGGDDDGDDGGGGQVPPGVPTVEAEATVTDSGLQIIDVVVGDGDVAEAGSTLTVHYTGWLMDGTKFESSHDSGQPVSFKLQGLIPGWEEGVPGMQVGGVRRLVIPPELAYGEAGRAPKIPPNAELIFDIELLEVAE